MSKYFYSDGVEQHGPFTLEELKNQGITRDTLVWYQGLREWQPAGELEELSGLFIYEPPPIHKPRLSEEYLHTNQDLIYPEKPPKNWLVESILVTLFCCLPFGIVGIVHAAGVESKFKSGDIEAAERASREAGKWTRIGFFSGIVVIFGYLIYIGVMFLTVGLGIF